MKKQSLILVLIGLIMVAAAMPAAFAEGPIEGRSGRAELRFLEGMSDHHQMAIDMSNDCLAKAANDSLRTLCLSIIDAQSAEIAQMQAWLRDWYNVAYTPIAMLPTPSDEAATADPMMEGMDHGDMPMDASDAANDPFADPAMMMGMMAGLNRLEGVEYEIAWMESMIDHHDDALHMSERILERAPEDTGHAELRALAQQIIDDQTAEIEQMETLLTELNA